MEGDQRILLHIEKVLAAQLVIFHSASGIHRSGLNFNVQNTAGGVGGCERQFASRLSTLPSMAAEAFTLNLIVLTSGVILKTDACARATA